MIQAARSMINDADQIKSSQAFLEARAIAADAGESCCAVILIQA